MSDVVAAILGGLSGLGMAVAAIIGAARRAGAAVQAENTRLRAELVRAHHAAETIRRQRARERARERMARDKAEVVMYQLLGVIERGEPDTGEIRRHHDAYLELASQIDSDSPQAGDDS